MRVVHETSTYKTQTVVLVDTTREDAERWAEANKPTGWRVQSVTQVRSQGRTWPNFTVTFKKGA